jgi:FMN phosphatase YigB (HAD superfamily)
MVGDSLEYDIVGASRVGMTTILIDRRSGCDSRRTVAAHVQPDYIIRDLREIGIILSCLDGVRK